jgi:hypothetical protein
LFLETSRYGCYAIASEAAKLKVIAVRIECDKLSQARATILQVALESAVRE